MFLLLINLDKFGFVGYDAIAESVATAREQWGSGYPPVISAARQYISTGNY